MITTLVGVANGGGFKGKLHDAIQRRLNHLPSASRLVHPALTVGETAFRVLVGVLFTFATAAYWIFERDRTVDLITSFIERPKRKKIRDTWGGRTTPSSSAANGPSTA